MTKRIILLWIMVMTLLSVPCQAAEMATVRLPFTADANDLVYITTSGAGVTASPGPITVPSDGKGEFTLSFSEPGNYVFQVSNSVKSYDCVAYVVNSESGLSASLVFGVSDSEDKSESIDFTTPVQPATETEKETQKVTEQTQPSTEKIVQETNPETETATQQVTESEVQTEEIKPSPEPETTPEPETKTEKVAEPETQLATEAITKPTEPKTVQTKQATEVISAKQTEQTHGTEKPTETTEATSAPVKTDDNRHIKLFALMALVSFLAIAAILKFRRQEV